MPVMLSALIRVTALFILFFPVILTCIYQNDSYHNKKHFKEKKSEKAADNP